MAGRKTESNQETAEYYFVYCDPCKYESMDKSAVGYCCDCKEHLCKQCLQSHRKFGAFRNHYTLIGEFQLKGKTENSIQLPLNKIGRNEMFKYIDHDFKSCGQCRPAKQSTCDCHDTQNIYTNKHQGNSQVETEDFKDSKPKSEKLKISNEERINAIKGVGQICKDRLNAMRVQMSEFFDTLEKDIDSVEVQQMSLNADLRETKAFYTEAANHILSIAEHLQQNFLCSENMVNFGSDCKQNNLDAAYSIAKTNASEKVISENLSKINMVFQNMSNNICDKEKAINAKVVQDIQKRTNIHYSKENLVTQPTSACTQNNLSTEKQKIFKNLKIRNKFLISIQEDESSNCNITDAVFLPNKYLVLCDFAHSTVILLDNRKFCVIDKLQLETRPWGIAVIDAHTIAVTLPDIKQLMYIKIESGKLKQAETINLHGVGSGICINGRDLFIVYKDSCKDYVEVRNVDGTWLKSFPIMYEPADVMYFYVSSHQVKGKAFIYISDGKSTIFQYTLDGHLSSKFQNDKIKWPRKILVDDNGDCIVSSSYNMKLEHVSNNFESTQELWKGYDIFKIWGKQFRNPQMLSMRWGDLTLVVGHESKNQIQVIKLYRAQTKRSHKERRGSERD